MFKVACCSSKARLALVKEIAGLNVYQEKRSMSEDELQKTEVEIRETEDSLANVQERLEQLDEEKNALEKLKQVERKKKAIEAVMLESELKEAKNKLKTSEQALGEIESTETKKKMAEVAQSSAQKKEALQTLKVKADGLELMQSTQSQRADTLEKRKEALRLRKVDLEEEIRVTQVSSGAGGKMGRLEQNLKQVEKSLNDVAAEAEKWESKLSEVSKERDAIYSRLGRSRQFPSVGARDRWIEKEVAKIRETIQEKQGFEKDLQALVQERKLKLRRVEEFERVRESKEDELRESVHGRMTQLTKEKAGYCRQRQEICTEVHKLQHQLQDEEESLKTLLDRLKKVLPGMKQVLQGLDTVNKVLEEVPHLKTGYHGLVSIFPSNVFLFMFPLKVVDNFKCPASLITAVEQSTGGGKLFHHVVDSDLAATEILKEINRRKLPGDFNFLPLNRIRSKQRKPFDREQTRDAFPILDKIEYQESFDLVMDFVFNGTLVCRDMSTAVQMARSTGRDCITIEGDKSSNKGVLTGGFLDKDKSRMGVWVKYRNTSAKVQKLKDQLSRLGIQRDGFMKSEAEVAQRVEEEKRRVRKMEAEVLEMSAEGTSREIRPLVREGDEQLGRLVSELRLLGRSSEKLESELGMEMNSQITSEEKERCEELTREIENAKKEFKQAHVQKCSLEGKLAEMSSKLKREEDEFNSEKLKRRGREKAERKVQLLDIELEEVKETLLKEREMQVETEKKAVEVARSLAEISKFLEELEAEEKRLTGIVATEEAEVQKLAESAARLRANYSVLVNKRDGLGGAAPELLQKYKGTGRKELGKRLESVLSIIKEHRQVNQKADDQFATFTKEEEKLSRRRDDLVATKAEVQNTLAVLDNTSAEQILYTYRQMYRNFATVFKELVPAGQGELLLIGDFETDSDEQNLEAAIGLSTSVTFGGDAEPRRNLEQLSGGQKTLVALAFILAIQRCDPAPFYLFDEVDAALDADYRLMIYTYYLQTNVFTTLFSGCNP